MTKSLSSEGARPLPYSHSSKSFSRYEPPKPVTPTRSRASTLQNEMLPNDQGAEMAESSRRHIGEIGRDGDVFEKRSSEDDNEVSKPPSSSPLVDRLPDGFDELPIELVSLTDR